MWLQSCHQKSAAGLACAASTTVKFIDNCPRAQTRPHWQGDWLFYTINDDEYVWAISLQAETYDGILPMACSHQHSLFN